MLPTYAATNKLYSFLQKNKFILLLLLIASLSFFLNFYEIGKYGYGNSYYAAAIRSMTMNFKNFFFVAFDPSGMVSVDKPPLGLWVQAAFVFIFGYHGWAMLLPQALAGTASTVMMYILTAKYFGKPAGLLSALFFALTPVVVVASRNNTMDMQLVFVLLIAAWFLLRSIERGKWRDLFICAALIGLGFNIKMLEAYLVLPGVALTYLFFAKERFGKRLLAGIISILIVISISFAWVITVDLYPKDQRPYVDSSSNNSVMELITGHNGMERIVGHDAYLSNGDGGTGAASQAGGEAGPRSVLRLWYPAVYGQISWLMIFSLFGIAALLKRITHKEHRSKQTIFFFFTVWLVSMGIFFSTAGFFHRYYLCMLAPAVAFLSATGLVKMAWYLRSGRGWRRFLLPAAFVFTMAVQLPYVWNYEELRSWLVPVMLGAALIAIVLMIGTLLRSKRILHVLSLVFLVISMLSAPLYWAYTQILYVPHFVIPTAGPEIAGQKAIASTTEMQERELEVYLLKNYMEGSFLVVSEVANDIARFVVDTGLPVYAYGGYLGTDNALSVEKLKEYVAEGKITYFLIVNQTSNSPELLEYVTTHASLVDSNVYSGSSIDGDTGYVLYSFS